MAKYHISPKDGLPHLCTAKANCPFGDNTQHYPTKEQAQHAADLQHVQSFSSSSDRYSLITLAPSDFDGSHARPSRHSVIDHKTRAKFMKSLPKAKVAKRFLVKKRPKDRKQVIELYSNGTVKIYSADGKVQITHYMMNSKYIKELYSGCGLRAPKSILQLADKNHKAFKKYSMRLKNKKFDRNKYKNVDF